ncbi:MAG: 3,4-dihydroxy-2-butanone-4-phosphate synthase, partial [Rhizobacter sp.]
MAIAPVPELVTDLAAGRMVILVDEEDRENEGDLILAADHVTPAAINFMARYARGLICLTLTRERCERLRLAPMAKRNGTRHGTAFTVSIEAAEGVTTGISAADRARTVQAAVARDAQPDDLVQPGHIFPLQAQDGGVLMRAGHTEAGCDLAAMAGLTPAAVICEVMNEDGSMARLPQLIEFGRVHGLKIGTIASLIEYRSRNESLIERVGARSLVTAQGEFDCRAFRDRAGGLHLPPMTRHNGTRHRTAFTVSIEAAEGVTTGISAHDRAHTVAVAINPECGRDHIVTPGHVFPLVAREGGVLVRAGHTEAAVDIARLAGLNPSGVICEIMAEDGSMARLDDLLRFARLHGLKVGT